MVVSTIAARAISSRVRSSVRWSTSDMVASGLARLRLLRGLSRFSRPAVRAETLDTFTTLGQWCSGTATMMAGYAGRASLWPCSLGAGDSTRCDCTGVGFAAAGSMEGASDLLSVCISRSSDLKIRIDLPNERAASGSFLAPNSKITTTARIAQCQGLRLPTLITSSRLPDATAAARTGGGPAPWDQEVTAWY